MSAATPQPLVAQAHAELTQQQELAEAKAQLACALESLETVRKERDALKQPQGLPRDLEQRIWSLADTLKRDGANEALGEVVTIDRRTRGQLLAEDFESIVHEITSELDRRRALLVRSAEEVGERCERCHGSEFDLDSLAFDMADREASLSDYSPEELADMAEDRDAGPCPSPTCFDGWEVGVQRPGETIGEDGLPVEVAQ